MSGYAAVACAMVLPLPEIKQREDEHPDEVDEMPVQAGDLDDLVPPFPAGEEAPLLPVEVAAPDLAGDDEQEDHADRHVGAVEPRDHEEGGAELRRAPGVPPGPDALADQLAPLESLHADECRPEGRGGQHQRG